jgi:NTP pyrophosphatase (non-canonical NTP hydrolase)
MTPEPSVNNKTRMTANEYQEFCQSVRLPTADTEYALKNLVGEVGELFSLLAKARRDGPKEDFRINTLKELGDIMWSVAIIARDYDFDLQSVMQGNVDKLSSRRDRGALQGSGDNR